jgi:hypothetical protein
MSRRAAPNPLPLLFALLVGPLSVSAEEPKLHVLWDTVSPDGKYALGWSTTDPDSPVDPGEDPTDNSSPVSTWLVEVASSNQLAQLPDLHFSKRLDHYWLETSWSEDSRYVLILLQQHFSRHNTTIKVLLGDGIAHQAVDLTGQIGHLLKERVQKDYGGSFFVNPWFVGPDRFSLFGDAGEHDYDFFFQFDKNGESLRLAKAVPATSSIEGSDRELNRAYQKLHGLLSDDDQKALVEEQRAWLTKRDAIKSAAKKDEFVRARSSELENRASQIVEHKSD